MTYKTGSERKPILCSKALVLMIRPTVYVWECGGAGNILSNFGKAAERKDSEAKAAREAHGASDLPTSTYADAIHLAACLAGQTLPMSPDLPADLFTCCLTSPIETSLRHFVLQDPLRRNISTSRDDPRSRVTIDMVMRIPGDLKDRRTPLGELNWIFTAVTDTIAWSSLPRDVFNRLFRQDLLVAALFRNFLLAQRIMNTYHCSPISIPELPNTNNHPLWHSWDLAVDACLAQLPGLLDQQDAIENGLPPPDPILSYIPSDFFAQHLQAFEVWLEYGGTMTKKVSIQTKKASHRPPPEQLPIVLQVLLSQGHRLRALILLSRFVDLGPWAVHLSLSIGIFPYVQKLLQSPAVELKPVLIFIWARILAVDRSCQVDLLRDQGYEYFARVLSPYPTAAGDPLTIPNANEHRAMCAFILSSLCRNFRAGQTACLAINIFETCLDTLQMDDWLLKTWSLLCIAQLWADNDDAKAFFITPSRQDTHKSLLEALRSTAVEVRAAALYAFSTFLGGSSAPANSTEYPGGGGTGAQMSQTDVQQLEFECGLAYTCMMSVKEDASPMVRKELVVVISCVAREWRGWFVCAAWAYYEHEAAIHQPEGGGNNPDIMTTALEGWIQDSGRTPEENIGNLNLLSNFKILFETLLDLSVDPSTEVALMASTVVDYIVALLLDSAFMRVKGSAVQRLSAKRRQALSRQQTGLSQVNGHGPSLPATNGAIPQLRRQNTGVSETSSNGSNSLKRNSSFAGGLLKGLATMTGLIAEESSTQSPSTPKSSLETKAPIANGANYTSPYPDASHPRILPDHSRAASSNTAGQIHTRVGRTGGLALSSSAFSEISGTPTDPAAVIETLTEEDLERLRIRRSKGTQAGGDVDGRLGNNGLARTGELGLGMVAKEVKDDVLPLRSGFYDWAVEYFKEPQMKVS
jgi:regulator-associated protein of mTOR